MLWERMGIWRISLETRFALEGCQKTVFKCVVGNIYDILSVVSGGEMKVDEGVAKQLEYVGGKMGLHNGRRPPQGWGGRKDVRGSSWRRKFWATSWKLYSCKGRCPAIGLQPNIMAKWQL